MPREDPDAGDRDQPAGGQGAQGLEPDGANDRVAGRRVHRVERGFVGDGLSLGDPGDGLDSEVVERRERPRFVRIPARMERIGEVKGRGDDRVEAGERGDQGDQAGEVAVDAGDGQPSPHTKIVPRNLGDASGFGGQGDAGSASRQSLERTPAFPTVSSHSASGSESATMPAPAW